MRDEYHYRDGKHDQCGGDDHLRLLTADQQTEQQDCQPKNSRAILLEHPLPENAAEDFGVQSEIIPAEPTRYHADIGVIVCGHQRVERPKSVRVFEP